MDIFDSQGGLRALSSEEVEMLSDDLRLILMDDVLPACVAATAGEDRLVAARVNVRQLMVKEDAARAANNAANPPLSHQEALADVVAANQGIKRKPRKSNEQTRLALAKVSDELAAARSELTAADRDLKTLSAERGTAIMKFIAAQEPISALDVTKAYLANNQKRLLDVAEGRAAAPAPPPAPRSELDRVLLNRRRPAHARVR
jgi:hypothetical protein